MDSKICTIVMLFSFRILNKRALARVQYKKYLKLNFQK